MDNTSITAVVISFICVVIAVIFFIRFQNLKKRMSDIELQNNNYESIIQQSNDAMLVIDIANGNICTANPKLSELLGYQHKQLLGLTVFDLHPKEMLNRSSEIIADVWEKKGLIYSDIPFVSSSGEILPVECSAKVIPYDGHPAILIYVRDIRERLRMEKEIRDKNAIIEQKNKDITDSINYAKKIQQAILSDINEIKNHLPNSFILFKPKDIVSGDFYWFSHCDNVTFIAAADCTGHGVPGGFMSMIGNTFLNEVVNEKKIMRPDQILNELREKVIHGLRQKGDLLESKDGMDISLCAINGNQLLFAGANNPLWLIRENEIKEFAADKQPIGIYPNPSPFTLHTEQLQKGDALYLFSDGYPDQFGGPKTKKFGYRNFRELLISIQDKSMDEQKKIVDEIIEKWKGNLDQVDDILVIGIKI